MTNEKLLSIGRSLEISDKDEWLVDNKILLVCRQNDHYVDSPDKFALIFNNGIRVGIVYFMGDYDIHWLVFPEHRGRGYLSHFVKSGVINIIEPELTSTVIDPYYCIEHDASEHLACLAGLRVFESEDERSAYHQKMLKDRQTRLDELCFCGSGKKYKYCCQKKELHNNLYEILTCPECDAYKSYPTAKRCWKCGAKYEAI